MIIPTYKGKAYIRTAVESVLPVSCTKQILVIDDGSPDDTYDYCCRQWSQEPQVKVLRKENGGIVDARNFGLDHAEGKYLLFIDHDDQSVASVVDQAVARAEETGADMVMWSTERLYADGSRQPCDRVLQPGVVDKSTIDEILLPEMLINQGNTLVAPIVHVWANLYRRSMIRQGEIRFRRFVDYEDDYLFVFDCLRQARKAVLLNQVGYYWFYNPKSETYRQKYIDHILERYEQMYRYFIEKMQGQPDEHYQTFIRQDVIVRAVENCATCLNSDQGEKRMLKKLAKENRPVFGKAPVAAYGGRRKRIFLLLRKGLVNSAFWYVYWDSVYRKYAKKLLAR